MITLLVLSKYQEIFDQFLASYERYGKIDVQHRRLLVADPGLKAPPDWEVIYFKEKYSQPRIMNFAISFTQGDVAFFSDDVQLTHSFTISDLSDAAYSRTDLGVVSPRIDGEVYNGLQRGSVAETGPVALTEAICHVCMYFKEQALKDAGGWDERMIGDSWEDVDHCMSLGKAGWKCGVTPTVVVKHGFGGRGDSCTWTRKTDRMPNGMAYNQGIFQEKWRGKLDFLPPLQPLGPISVVLKQLQEGK
jgi:hypothetical protein